MLHIFELHGSCIIFITVNVSKALLTVINVMHASYNSKNVQHKTGLKR